MVLQDEKGVAWANATVNYVQTTHDFLFGVGMTSPRGRVPPRIYSDLRDIDVNYALPFVSWANVEPERGTYTWNTVDYMYRPAEMQQQGYTLNGHATIWLFDERWNLPSYVRSMTFTELNQAAYQHVYDLVSHYRGIITYWTINEPLFYHMAMQLSYEQWAELVRTTTQAAHAADPESKVIVNLPPVEQAAIDYSPHRFLDLLASKGVDYDVIGIQMWADARIGYQVDDIGYIDVEWASSLLDSFARFGKPVMVSETGVPDKPSLQAQAEWLHRFYAMAFEKPFIAGITWYFIDDDLTVNIPAFAGCGLFPDFNSEPRPIYQALASVIRERKTQGVASTDSQGLVTIEGYAGDYVVEVRDGVRTATFTAHIAEEEDAAVTVSASSELGKALP